MMNPDDPIIVPALLDDEECRFFIEKGEALGFLPAAISLASGPVMRPGVRDNDRVEFVAPELAAALWGRCFPFVPSEMDGGTAVGLDDRFRFYRYDVGQRFRRHRDGVASRSATIRSRLTCLIYLNGGFEGGETVIYPDGPVADPGGGCLIVEPQPGAALFFRHERWHEGRAPRSGRKYVLRSDVFYRSPGPTAGS